MGDVQMADWCLGNLGLPMDLPDRRRGSPWGCTIGASTKPGERVRCSWMGRRWRFPKCLTVLQAYIEVEKLPKHIASQTFVISCTALMSAIEGVVTEPLQKRLTSLTWKVDNLTELVKKEQYPKQVDAFGMDLAAIKAKIDGLMKTLEDADLGKK